MSRSVTTPTPDIDTRTRAILAEQKRSAEQAAREQAAAEIAAEQAACEHEQLGGGA